MSTQRISIGTAGKRAKDRPDSRNLRDVCMGGGGASCGPAIQTSVKFRDFVATLLILTSSFQPCWLIWGRFSLTFFKGYRVLTVSLDCNINPWDIWIPPLLINNGGRHYTFDVWNATELVKLHLFTHGKQIRTRMILHDSLHRLG